MTTNNEPDPITCAECGAEDVEFLPHNPGCPERVVADRAETAFLDAVREYEDQA